MTTDAFDATTKTCPICQMGIPAQARKCPYCLHWHTKFDKFWHHPFLHLAVLTLVFGGWGLLFSVMLRDTFDRGEPFAAYAGQIEVRSSRVEFGDAEAGPTVAVIGRVRNSSDVDWKDFVFHVEFQDADGILTDAGQEVEYYEVLPAGEELGFKVSFHREFAESAYVKHSVRVVSARDVRSRWF